MSPRWRCVRDAAEMQPRCSQAVDYACGRRGTLGGGVPSGAGYPRGEGYPRGAGYPGGGGVPRSFSATLLQESFSYVLVDTGGHVDNNSATSAASRSFTHPLAALSARISNLNKYEFEVTVLKGSGAKQARFRVERVSRPRP